MAELYDVNGRQFRANDVCVREHWAMPFGNELNDCYSWRVIAAGDGLLRLLSRPEQHTLVLTEHLASRLMIYEEAPELVPELFPMEWHIVLNAGWGVFGYAEGQRMVLQAWHPDYDSHPIPLNRSPGRSTDSLKAKHMWQELLAFVQERAREK